MKIQIMLKIWKEQERRLDSFQRTQQNFQFQLKPKFLKMSKKIYLWIQMFLRIQKKN